MPLRQESAIQRASERRNQGGGVGQMPDGNEREGPCAGRARHLHERCHGAMALQAIARDCTGGPEATGFDGIAHQLLPHPPEFGVTIPGATMLLWNSLVQ